MPLAICSIKVRSIGGHPSLTLHQAFYANHGACVAKHNHHNHNHAKREYKNTVCSVSRFGGIEIKMAEAAIVVGSHFSNPHQRQNRLRPTKYKNSNDCVNKSFFREQTFVLEWPTQGDISVDGHDCHDHHNSTVEREGSPAKYYTRSRAFCHSFLAEVSVQSHVQWN